MKKIMVVYDGTEASRLLHELMIVRVQDQGLDAQVVRHDIQRDSESGLSKGSGISEFRGRIDDLAAHVSDVDLLMVHLAPVSHEVIEAAPKLRFIASERSSLPNIDVACARKHGIAVSYAAGRNARTVAEFTVGLMLDVTRFISAGNQLIKQGSWNSQLDRRPYTGIEMEGKRIGLLGLGGIARNVVKLLSGFGAEIVYYDPFFAAAWDGCLPVSREELLSTSDILSIHARSDDGKCLVDAQDIAHMKHGAYLINTARGFLVDEPALIAALQSGQLRGAALDVFAQEPLPLDSPLITMPNVVLCPHLGGLSQDMNPRSAQFAAEDAIRFLKGEPLLHAYRG